MPTETVGAVTMAGRLTAIALRALEQLCDRLVSDDGDSFVVFDDFGTGILHYQRHPKPPHLMLQLDDQTA